jgi:hypothetical protein
MSWTEETKPDTSWVNKGRAGRHRFGVLGQSNFQLGDGHQLGTGTSYTEETKPTTSWTEES